MQKRKFITYIALFSSSLSIFVTACATSKLSEPQKQPAGFLPDYSILQKVTAESDNNVKLLRYIDPQLNVNNYHAVIIDPVIIYGEQQVESGLMQRTRLALDQNLHEMVSKKFNIVTASGPGVVRLSVAIAGAELNGDGFKPRNLIPVSAALKLMTMATGYDNKTAVIEIAAKIIDSESTKLLGASVATINSEKFRNSNNNDQAFEQLVKKWTVLTVKNAADYKNN